MQHKVFKDIVNYLHPGDCLVINDTKVIPARLIGSKEGTDAHIEILLLKRRENDIWETLVKPGKKAKPGTVINFGDGLLKGTVIDVVEEGNRLIQFSYEGIFEEILDQLGQMPLPPYITHRLQDKNRYQTVYAEHEGSAAAPTAGLHFTKELLAQIQEMGVKIAHVTLHVGLGTFRPVKVSNVLDHHMHSEFYRIEEDAANMINETKQKWRTHYLCRYDKLPDAGIRSSRGRHDPRMQRLDGHFHLSRLPVQDSGLPDHKLPPAGVHARHAGIRTGRQRTCAHGV